jgi:hypothetical protein
VLLDWLSCRWSAVHGSGLGPSARPRRLRHRASRAQPVGQWGSGMASERQLLGLRPTDNRRRGPCAAGTVRQPRRNLGIAVDRCLLGRSDRCRLLPRRLGSEIPPTVAGERLRHHTLAKGNMRSFRRRVRVPRADCGLFVFVRWYAALRQPGQMIAYTVATGVLFFAAFFGIARGSKGAGISVPSLSRWCSTGPAYRR